MKTKFVLTIVFYWLTKIALAQTLTVSISSSVSSSQLACVNDFVEYNATTNIPSAVCSVTWSITAGAGTYVTGFSSTSNPTRIRWGDQKPNKGTVQASVKYFRGTATCSSGAEYATASRTTTIRSVFGESLDGIVSPRDVPLCAGNQVVAISANPLYIKNTGTGTSIPLTQVERYQWILPTGWRQAGTVNTGTILTSAPNISIEPANPGGSCSVAGAVRVVGIAAGYSQCVGTPQSVSNQSTINITRSQTFDLTSGGGFTTQTCGRSASVVFTATSIPCATSYSWSYTGGWNGPATTTTNLATVSPVKPDGTIVNTAGSVTVTANLSTGCGVSKVFNIGYSNTVPLPTFQLSNNHLEICDIDGPFQMNTQMPTGYATGFGCDYYATGGILINGVTSSQSTPFHTGSVTVTVSVPGSVYGTQTFAVRLNNPACPITNYVSTTRKIGPYSNSEFSIIGPQQVCPNQAADFRPSFITSDVTGYQWSAPSGWGNSGQGTPYFSVSVPSPFFGGAITLRLQNRCGWTNTPYVLNLNSGSCFSFSASPNPVSETLSISDLDPEQVTTATLIDGSNKNQRSVSGKGNKLELNVAGLPNGLYILRLEQKNVIETTQIQIKN